MRHAAGFAFTSYAVALIAARLILGHLPDRTGGARVALICVLIEATGLALIGLAPSAILAALGAALSGLAMLWSFPDSALRPFVLRHRSAADWLWALTRLVFDLALGISGPMLGFIAHGAGLSADFLISALLVLCAAPIALRLQQTDD